ncbi:CCAAT enhancer-binding zeta-like, partial [Paramuricea clavata]
TLKDLCLVNLLPDDRKLKRFSEFPLTSAPQKTNQSGRDAWNRKLIFWYFEDQLKQRYERFVLGLERLLHDNLENVRNKVLGIVYELLAEKPEQEKTLLLYLVNKVGDPNRKIASKAGHLLGCL